MPTLSSRRRHTPEAALTPRRPYLYRPGGALIWDQQILTLFPNATNGTARQIRAQIRDDLEGIRKLRNRMAHHEPIFTRNLADDLARMLDLIELRSGATAQWVRAMEEVSSILTERP